MINQRSQHVQKAQLEKLQAECATFNAVCAIGDAVDVMLDGSETPFRTTTRSEAQVFSGHSAVIWLNDVSGCYLLDRVTPVAAPPVTKAPT